jgi:hypothetical protein
VELSDRDQVHDAVGRQLPGQDPVQAGRADVVERGVDRDPQRWDAGVSSGCSCVWLNYGQLL